MKRPRLKESDVRDIRRRHRKKEGTRSLAKRFHVTTRTIQFIISKERWGWLK